MSQQNQPNQPNQLNEALERRIAVFRVENPRFAAMNNRVIAEMLLAQDYVLNYNHGTSGHLGYIAIDAMIKAFQKE